LQNEHVKLAVVIPDRNPLKVKPTPIEDFEIVETMKYGTTALRRGAP